MTEFASSPCMMGEFGLGEPLVTRAVPGEAHEIAAVLVASIRELCIADHANDPQKMAGWIANKTPQVVAGWIADPAQDLLVSREAPEGPIAAVGAANAEWLLLNYVAPAFRGRGHSRAMLAALEVKMAVRGAHVAKLMSTETARDFYRAHGWRDVGPGTCDGCGGMRGYAMVKDLAL